MKFTDPLPKLANAVAGFFGAFILVICIAVAVVALLVYWILALPIEAWAEFKKLSRRGGFDA